MSIPTANFDSGGKFPAVDQWDPIIAQQQAVVYNETGVEVPIPVIKAIIQNESQGDPNVGCSNDGYCGLMQTGPGSMGAPYDMQRDQTDPSYEIYTGTKELALREIDSHYLPWDNVASGYFSGNYQIGNGTVDSQFGTTDSQYVQAFDANLKAFNGTPDPAVPGSGGGVPYLNSGALDAGAITQAVKSGAPKILIFGAAAVLLALGALWLF